LICTFYSIKNRPEDHEFKDNPGKVRKILSQKEKQKEWGKGKIVEQGPGSSAQYQTTQIKTR
jgi:hypothetical protein